MSRQNIILEVKPGDWIKIGENLDALVVQIYEKKNFGDIEVVYLDYRDKAINDDVIWTGEKWEFTHTGASGGYADKYDRLKEFVSILRQGKFSK